jgi:hypothetical protein
MYQLEHTAVVLEMSFVVLRKSFVSGEKGANLAPKEVCMWGGSGELGRAEKAA